MVANKTSKTVTFPTGLLESAERVKPDSVSTLNVFLAHLVAEAMVVRDHGFDDVQELLAKHTELLAKQMTPQGLAPNTELVELRAAHAAEIKKLDILVDRLAKENATAADIKAEAALAHEEVARLKKEIEYLQKLNAGLDDDLQAAEQLLNANPGDLVKIHVAGSELKSALDTERSLTKKQAAELKQQRTEIFDLKEKIKVIPLSAPPPVAVPSHKIKAKVVKSFNQMRDWLETAVILPKSIAMELQQHTGQGGNWRMLALMLMDNGANRRNIKFPDGWMSEVQLTLPSPVPHELVGLH